MHPKVADEKTLAMKRGRLLFSWRVLLLVLLTGSALAGCGGKGASPATATAPKGETGIPAVAGAAPGALPPASQRPEVGSGPAATAPRSDDRRGYVVLVDGMRVVIDLADGEVKKDALIAITRRQRLTHPVTGEHLGEITQEVGRARILEVQPKFSVAELIGFRPGLTVKPQDRVTVLPGTP